MTGIGDFFGGLKFRRVLSVSGEGLVQAWCMGRVPW